MRHTIMWQDNLANARLLAEKQNKPIFVDWADFPSCVGCVSLENTTYPNEEVISYLNEQFIPVQLNQSQNLAFFKENEVFWIPTVTVCDALSNKSAANAGRKMKDLHFFCLLIRFYLLVRKKCLANSIFYY